MALKAFELYRMAGIVSMPEGHGPEGASQSYVKGAVVIETSGLVVEAGADPTNVVGVAAHAARNVTTNPKCFYDFPLESVEFIGSLDTSASEGTGTCVATDRGAEYGITKTSLTGVNTGKWYVDKNKTGGSARVRVTEIIDPVNTVHGRVAFKFLTAAKATA